MPCLVPLPAGDQQHQVSWLANCRGTQTRAHSYGTVYAGSNGYVCGSEVTSYTRDVPCPVGCICALKGDLYAGDREMNWTTFGGAPHRIVVFSYGVNDFNHWNSWCESCMPVCL